jgi:hypothetical protein
MTDDEHRRAIDSLVQIGGRMRYLAHGATSNPTLITPQKLSGELDGMAAWVIAFARQLGGYRDPDSVELPSPMRDLISLELAPESPPQADEGEAAPTWACEATWPSQGLSGESSGAGSPELAALFGLIALATVRATHDGLAVSVAMALGKALGRFGELGVADDDTGAGEIRLAGPGP